MPNIMRLYQEFRDELDQPLNPLEVFEAMRRMREELHLHEEGESGMCCV